MNCHSFLLQILADFTMVKPCGARKRYSNDELTIEQRAMIVSEYNLGVPVNTIAGKYHIHRNTIRNIAQKFLVTGTVNNRKRQGRPRMTSSNQDNQLRLLSLRNRRLSACQIKQSFNAASGVNISTTTVKRRLNAAGIFGRIARKKPFLTASHICARLQWARLHELWSEDDWNKVLFTDESKFEIFGGNRRVYVRRRQGESILPQCLTTSVKHGGGSVMVWGCFGGGRTGDLYKVQGIMKKEQYHQILIKHTIPSGIRLIGRNFIYQADNDPKHKSKLCTTYLNRKENEGVLKVMKWPSQSPDLNPIELAWDELDRQVRKVQIRNEQHLFDVLREACAALNGDYLQKLILRMPKICRAVIASRGHHIDENI